MSVKPGSKDHHHWIPVDGVDSLLTRTRGLLKLGVLLVGGSCLLLLSVVAMTDLFSAHISSSVSAAESMTLFARGNLNKGRDIVHLPVLPRDAEGSMRSAGALWKHTDATKGTSAQEHVALVETRRVWQTAD